MLWFLDIPLLKLIFSYNGILHSIFIFLSTVNK